MFTVTFTDSKIEYSQFRCHLYILDQTETESQVETELKSEHCLLMKWVWEHEWVSDRLIVQDLKWKQC